MRSLVVIVPLTAVGLALGFTACATSDDEIPSVGSGGVVGSGGGTTTGGAGTTGGTPTNTGGTPTSTGGTSSNTGGTSITCADGQELCGTFCVYLGTDDNCSACDDACGDGAHCDTGATSSGGGAGGASSAAPSGPGECACDDTALTKCEDGCYDTSSDAAHCGDTCEVCGENEECSEGSCTCPYTDCDGACKDTTTDPTACGESCTPCAENEECEASLCVCNLTVCGEACTDTTSDPANCGGCISDGGVACNPGEVCNESVCELPELLFAEPNTKIEVVTGATFNYASTLTGDPCGPGRDTGVLRCDGSSGGEFSITVTIDGVDGELTGGPAYNTATEGVPLEGSGTITMDGADSVQCTITC